MFKDHQYFVYIMTNRPGGTLYVGMTNDIFRRAAEHRAGEGSQFTMKYRLTRLVYYEGFVDVNDAIYREKRLKHWPRLWKLNLIEKIRIGTASSKHFWINLD